MSHPSAAGHTPGAGLAGGGRPVRIGRARSPARGLSPSVGQGDAVSFV